MLFFKILFLKREFKKELKLCSSGLFMFLLKERPIIPLKGT